MRRDWALYLGILIALGAAWGITQPMSKIAVSEGYRHFGLIFWQFVIAIAILAPINRMRRQTLPFTPRHIAFYLFIALIGTLLPNSASYTAAIHLPSGVISILLSLVPMLAFPIALALGMDRFSPVRLFGLALGLMAIGLIAGPEASLPDPAMVLWVPIAVVAPLLYAIEGNFVARFGTAGLDPVQLLLGAALFGSVLAFIAAQATGQWINPLPPYGAPDLAVVVSSVAHCFAYVGYVWLVGRAGAVFAAQVAYLVTGFGILWAMLILGETYSPWVWLAVACMMGGLFLVQPRKPASEAEAAQQP
jgi:drug/metabolite transporter (DMT)-like permease